MWAVQRPSAAIWHESHAIIHPPLVTTWCHNSFTVRLLFISVPHSLTVSERWALERVTRVSAGCCVLSALCSSLIVLSVTFPVSVHMCVCNGSASLVSAVVQLQVTLGSNQPNAVPDWLRVEAYTSQVFLTMALRHLTPNSQPVSSAVTQFSHLKLSDTYFYVTKRVLALSLSSDVINNEHFVFHFSSKQEKWRSF